MRVVPRWAAGLAVVAGLMTTACMQDLVQPDPQVLPLLFNVEDLGLQRTGQVMILGVGGRLPLNLEERVAAAGGTVVSVIPEIGVAFAESNWSGFAGAARGIPGVESAVPDVILQWTDPGIARGEAVLESGEADASDVTAFAVAPPTDPFYLGLQWAPQALDAPQAWAAGYTGLGVRVAILDGGIRDTHVDLAPNLDVAASRSFITGAFNTDLGTFWHGTHVAGIVAAAANGIGTVGIAPEATLIGVKVLHGGSGPFQSILNGIMYAATPLVDGGAGAHVINMSLGAVLPRRDLWDDPAFRAFFNEWKKVFDRATRYAYMQGVTVIAAAGNSALNYDGGNIFFGIPAQNQHVISVSATGPHGWALGATDFHRPAYYTNFGKSLVDLGAPGGTVGLFVVDGVDQLCVRPIPPAGSTLQFCETFDMILSTSRGSGASNTAYSWAQGTSMASPAVAGIAALVIQRYGGSAPPALVRAILSQSAADLGKPGQDEWYGNGWVNALRAVQ